MSNKKELTYVLISDRLMSLIAVFLIPEYLRLKVKNRPNDVYAIACLETFFAKAIKTPYESDHALEDLLLKANIDVHSFPDSDRYDIIGFVEATINK